MTRSAIPTCYFPSTVLFVDDSRDFLQNFTLQLDDDLAYRVFDAPYEALEAINSAQAESDNVNQRCVSEYLESNAWPMTNQTVNLDLAAIHWEVYNPQRFGEISVLVVDYAMPGMNGLEFCKRLENSPIKKILLTGRADEKTAIEAFNEGIIDRFVRKNDPDVTTLINQSIHNLQRQYFQNMSEMITKMLSVNSPSCLQDDVFADFFKKLCDKHNIVEFYLTENSGSFLMLNKAGEPSSLIIKNEHDVKMHYDLALDNRAPQEVLDRLKEGSSIPYFMDSHGNQDAWSDWSTSLYPAEKLQGKETYYYAYITNPNAFDIRRNKILAYQEYLQKMDVDGVATSAAL